jgi:hypothetical protein
MFKYIKFEKVSTEDTVLEFRGGSEDVKVNHFNVSVVSLAGEEVAIDEVIASQDARILCEEIAQEEFKSLVTDSTQLNRIREVVAKEIAKKYSLADEIAMSKRDESDGKRIAYETYVTECLAIGYGLKAEIGY